MKFVHGWSPPWHSHGEAIGKVSFSQFKSWEKLRPAGIKELCQSHVLANPQPLAAKFLTYLSYLINSWGVARTGDTQITAGI